jgi:large subunit ribosomal protein L29
MGISGFDDIKLLSNLELSNEIIKTEKVLFDLRFKKATRQSFKSHEFKIAKCRLAQLKTTLTSRLEIVEQKTSNAVAKLIDKDN